MFVDSHCHLHRLQEAATPDAIATLLQTARDQQVEHFLCVSVQADDIQFMQQHLTDMPDVSWSWGIHPLYVESLQAFQEHQDAAQDTKVIAIGETGLDYHYSTDTKPLQQSLFEHHIELALQTQKPLIVHTRDAREDTISILKNQHADRVQGILHCFTENYAMAKAALDLGFYISFSGILTFKNATELQAVAKKLPLDRVLIETDSPYLAPVPHRGQENQPSYVTHVAASLADLRQTSAAEIGRITTDNFYRLFPSTRP
ncbi:MAG: TatD family hydrolase [Shewanellaceae bacterium]|nr:TatD family hydrolase [Shewanellaceae bacterium]